MKRGILGFLFLAASAALAIAEVPIRNEQLIWSVIASTVSDYAATFVPDTSSTIYLIAGQDNILSTRKTLLYWWPITEEWKPDTESLNILFPGTLEVRDSRGNLRSYPLEEYTYFNVKGEYEKNWKILTGEAARAEIQKYKALYNQYFTDTEKYQADTASFEAEVQRLVNAVQSLKDAGKDFSAPLHRMQSLNRPIAPVPPTDYVVPPSDLQQGFIVNLPAGRYSILLRNPDGTLMEGSEKELVVDSRRRTNGIGFEIIPSDKWTRPVESMTPSSVIYVNGTADLYVRPFFEDEFNDLSYEKTANNQARGNPTIQKWVRIQQVPHATVVTAGPGDAQRTLSEQPYYVEQSSGSSLGYTIIPWDPAGPYKDQGPNLIAFRVPLEKNARVVRLRTLDENGRSLQGSDRQIRLVAPLRAPALLVVFAMLPLVLMSIVLLARSRSYGARPSGEK